jgi:chorismate synthase
VGCVIDGCPPKIPPFEVDMQVEVDRRRPKQSHITTLHKEIDICCILSGLFEGQNNGTPIVVLVPNTNQRGNDYNNILLGYISTHMISNMVFI